MTINRVNGSIGFNISNLPFNTNVINLSPNDSQNQKQSALSGWKQGAGIQETENRGMPTQFNSKLSFPYEGFLNKIQRGVKSLLSRQFDSQTRNPDFNLLSANGTAPVTEAQGSDYQFVDKWFVNTGGGNSYTLTPTAYVNPTYANTGSNYYMNVKVTALNSPLYLWNQNYSTTGQFNSLGKINDTTMTFSSIISNNNSNLPKVRFSIFLSDTGQEIKSGAVYLQPNSINLVSISVKIPDMKDVPYVNPYAEPRFYIEDLDGGPIDIDISYIKSEISEFATDLNLNHVLEEIICNALT